MKWRFVCENDCISRTIAWWGNGWRGFGHVDASVAGGYLGARSDRKGGKPPGVQLRPKDYLKGHLIRVSILDIFLPPLIEDELQDWLLKQIGRKYDISDIGDLLLGRRAKNNGQWICSALQDEGAQKFKLYHFPGIPAQQITPDTFHALLCSRGAKEISAYDGPAV